jgi:hypothetical protein
MRDRTLMAAVLTFVLVLASLVAAYHMPTEKPAPPRVETAPAYENDDPVAPRPPATPRPPRQER